MRDMFHVLDFTNGEFTPDSFKKWIGENYVETKSVTTGNITANYVPTEIPAKPIKIAHACIYFDTGNFPTDYSYIFDSTGYKGATVTVYNWQDLIFSGDTKEFEKWIKKQK